VRKGPRPIPERQEGQTDIDGETWKVAIEEVDRCAAFHCEFFLCRHDGQEINELRT